MTYGWDEGVRWFSRRTVAPTALPVTVAFVRDQVLRVMNDGAEDSFVRAAIVSATQAAEDWTQRALMPQTWEMVLSGFPCSQRIELVRPPFIAVTSIAYYDTDNASQSLAGSPAEYAVTPSGYAARATVRPLQDEVFPETACRPDAVTVTFTCGHEDDEDAELQQVNTGIALMVGELYKLRSLSVQGSISSTPSVLQMERFWRRTW